MRNSQHSYCVVRLDLLSHQKRFIPAPDDQTQVDLLIGPNGAEIMIKLGAVLTALATTVAITPYAAAAADIDTLNPATPGSEVVRADLLPYVLSEATPTASTIVNDWKSSGDTASRREHLNQTAIELNEELPDNSQENPRLELVIIEF